MGGVAEFALFGTAYGLACRNGKRTFRQLPNADLAPIRSNF